MATNDMSILNPSPKRMEGPSLLHDLVPTKSHDSDPAIDYLPRQGPRQRITYDELHQRATQLACKIRVAGNVARTSQPGRFIIPLLIPQSPDLYISQLATLKAGAAFCPIALDVPEERLRFILQDVGASVLLTTSALRESLPQLDGVALLSVDVDMHGSEEGLEIISAVDPSDAAYVMYTSGSTGKPKGCILSHSAATQALLAHDRHIPAFRRFLQFASPTFDVSVFEIFFPLFRAATLVCGDRRELLSDLPGFIDKMTVDAAELTPSVASSLLNGRSSVPGLKTLLTIGEMLKRDVVEEFGGNDEQDAILHGMFGPTEATIHCTLQPAFSSHMSVGNIGIPLDTVSAFVVKPSDASEQNATPEIVALGQEGELAVGGHQLADGYLNRPEQTSAAFVHHPKYGPLYRTGDRAKMTQAGNIECLGRISSGQVKLRGQRIELGEVEYAVSKTPGCQSVAAEVISGTLVVFLTTNGKPIERSSVLDTCRKWLPGFMVPGDLVFLESLPYLASGKLDRKALHSIFDRRASNGEQSTEAIPERLRSTIDVLSTALGASIAPSTKLASAGLDSLAAIRIAAQLRRAGFPGLDATKLLEAQTPRDIEQLYANSTLRDQDQSQSSARSEPASQLYNAIKRLPIMCDHLGDVEDVFEATPVQAEMLSETARDSKAYCNWIEFALPPRYQASHIARCLADLAAHHPILRSGFISVGGMCRTTAVITWKAISSSQVQSVQTLDRDFEISSEQSLLRPLAFQILKTPSDTRLLLLAHHALYDQWSVDLLRSDLDALLSGKALGPCPSFRPMAFFHADQQSRERSDAAADFWQEELREFSPTLLPPMTGKRKSPALKRTSWRALNQLHPSKLRASTQALGCSVPAVFQAALVHLLGSYAGSSDVTYGSVFSGRHVSLDDIERMIGPCLSTMPIRVDYNATRCVKDLLRHVHDRSRAVQRHSHLPISKIKSAAGLNAAVTLFDVLFVWQETTLLYDGNIKEVDSADQYNFNLVVEFEPLGDDLLARVTFQQSLITHEQVDLFLNQAVALVTVMLDDPERLVEHLPRSLPDSMLSLWNTRPTYCSPGHDLIRVIERNAARKPSSPALIFARDSGSKASCLQTISYEELNSRANRLAHYLRSFGNQPSGVVCICMEKSVDLYVAILAVVKAGFGYLPLLPDVPAARFVSVIKQSQIELCLCDSDSAERFQNTTSATVVDVTKSSYDSWPSYNLPSTIAGSQVAYTVYTSGSTGEPKGVAVTVENLLGNLQALAELYQVQSGDRLLQACSQAFDVSVFEIFFAFYSGICLCSASKDVLFADLEANIRGFGITHLSLTPTVAALIAPSNVPSVKFLVTAGEAVTELVHARWAGRGLHQGYGPSETTNICSINMNTQPDDVLGNIGPPFRNTSAMVLAPGPGFNLLPSGAVGEFAFGGEQVFKGYVGMNDLNAEKIIHHPIFGRVYKSGDIGRILHDGTLLISGRLDDQVKVRGNRIELGEINALLLKNSDVRDSTTLVVGEDPSQADLVSFVVLESTEIGDSADTTAVAQGQETMKELFGELEDALPGYMVPSLLIPVNKLPLTSQGKLDRRVLKDLLAGLDDASRSQCSRSAGDQEDNDEWSETERTIVSTLETGLSLRQSSVSRNASFFSLGLNSLSAVSFAKHLGKTLNLRVNPGIILRNPTVSRLARHLDRHSNLDARPAASPIQQLLSKDIVSEVMQSLAEDGGEVSDVLPCTPLQEAMISAGTVSNSSYCNTTWLDILGNTEKVKESWEAMMERHAILRTKFVETSSSSHPVVQVVLAQSALPWTERGATSTGVTEHSNIEMESQVQSRAPFKIDVFRTAVGTKMALRMHHALYDGISVSVLLREVEERFRGQHLLATPSFREFLQESRRQASQESMDFWTSRLQGLLPSPFPRRTAIQESEETALSCGPLVTQAEVDHYCRRQGVTPLVLFQAALMKMLSHVQSTTDVCIGNVVDGRSVPVEGVDRLVAPCFNTIPVRADLSRTRSNLDLLKHLAQSNAEAVDHQLAPLRRLQTISKDPSRRLFDALILLQPSDLELDRGIWRLDKDEGSMGLPLVMEICPVGKKFTLVLHHTHAFITPELAQELQQAFGAALKSCLTFPLSDVTHFHGEISDHVEGALAPAEDMPHTDSHFDSSFDDDQGEWSAEEELVRNVFARRAGVASSRISKTTSMYQLGLDSLNAPQVASQLRASGYTVDAADVIEALTPQAIAKTMISGRDRQDDLEIDLQAFDARYRAIVLDHLQIPDSDVLKVRPTTAVQNGMLAQSIHSNGDLYINHVKYRLPDDVSSQRLQSAWVAVANKHELLRAGFHNLNDPEWPFAMVVRRPDVTALPLTVQSSPKADEDIELAARREILQSLNCSAWHVTLTPGAMTVSMHHGIYDAESLTILHLDLVRALDFGSCGGTGDIDHLLKSTISSERRAAKSSAARTFWSSALASSAFVKLPDLNPTAAIEARLDIEELKCSLMLPDLERYCRREAATIQALGQAAWGLLLATYTGEDCPTFGTVFSGRNDSSAWQTAFPSVVTVPVPCNAARPYGEMVRSMVDFNATSQRHRSTPLADIQRHVGEAGRSIFDTVFVYQKGVSNDRERTWPVIRETAGVDYAASLELEIDDHGSIRFRLTFNTARLPPTQAQLMLRQYDHLLGQVISAGGPAAKPSNVALASIVRPKVTEIPIDVCLLHEFVEQGAVRHPTKVAFEFVSGFDHDNRPTITKWTYAELDDTANRIANAISDAGARPGSTVALCMDKCPEATFAFVGILKAGCAFLALDPDLPPDRIRFILEDSASSALLVRGHDRTPDVPSAVSLLDVSLDGLKRYSNRRPEVSISPSSNSYVLYTSGTTGTPKGCEITHENAVQAMCAFQRLFAGHWTASSRWLQFASYWFDVSVLEQFWSWSVGISVVGAPRDLVLEDISAFIRALSITHIDLTPSLARLVHPEDVPSLWGGVFITGGEALKQEIINAWGPKHTICNGYGPTEATIGVTMNTFIDAQAKPSNIGRAFDNVGAYVLDPDGFTPVMRGGVGELCVSGKLVGKGYLNRLELTKKQFPYATELGERIYRTGDLVRLLFDGSFQFIGRKDSQAKLRGQRLEIEEIDSVIRSSTGEIENALSMVVKNEGGKETLVSFVTSQGRSSSPDLEVGTSDQAVDIVQQARSACEQKLAGYMVPTHIIPLNLLPLTVNKKVDTKRLTSLFDSLDTKRLQELKRKGGSSRELTTSERKVAKTLGSMFEIELDQIASDSNVFSLGLSSISAISFASFLKHAGFTQANVATIMKNQTIGQLAAALATNTDDLEQDRGEVQQAKLAIKAHSNKYLAAAAKALKLPAEDIEIVVPCTPLQQGLLLESLRGDDRPYFNHFEYTLHDVDLEKLERACHSLVNDVQVLRSSFLAFDDGYSQVIRKSSQTPVLRSSSRSSLSSAYLLEKRQQWVLRNSKDVRTPCELHIAEFSDSVVFAVHIHHAIYDGISYDLMIKRLWQRYFGGRIDASGPSFTDSLPYGPLKPVINSAQFWKRRLNSGNVGSLRSRHSSSASDSMIRMPLSDHQRLEDIRQSVGVSHQAIAQAAFEVALRQAPFLNNVQIYGMVVSGRSFQLEGADNILGPMFNTLPHPITATPESTIAEQIRRCQDLNVEALPYQHTALRDVRKWTGLSSGSSTFDILFVFQQQTPANDSDALWTPLESPSKAEYPLACEFELQRDGSLDVTLLAQCLYFSQAEIEAFASTLSQVFEAMYGSNNVKLGDAFGILGMDGATDFQQSANSTPHINGVEHFEWSEEALAIRKFVAQLAGLDVEEVDEHTSVFSIGLDSIDAVKMASRLRSAGVSLPVSEILRAQTIPRMVARIESKPDDNQDKPSKSLEELEQRLNQRMNFKILSGSERILPATPNQEALVADMLRSDFKEYLNHDILQLEGHVDLDRLKDAWQQVVDSSPILRTSFVQTADAEIDAVFAQVVHRTSSINWSELHIGGISQIDAYLDTVRNDVAENFERMPAVRLAVAFTGRERYLILTIAHALYDGHSLALLHSDLQSAYENALNDRPSYDAAIEAPLSAAKNEDIRFWTDTLSSLSPRPFSGSQKSAAIEKTHRAEATSKIVSDQARSFCQAQGVSMQALAQTCWALTLAHYSQSMDVVFGVVLACRDSEEAEQIMFPMMNTVAMGSSLHGTKADMLSYMQSTISEMLPHQRTPLRLIQKARSQSAGDGPLFDTLFIYQHRPSSRDAERTALYHSVKGSSSIDYPVAVEMEAIDSDLIIRAACKDSVLDAEGTGQLIKTVDLVLGSIVASADKPTVDLRGGKAYICGLAPFDVDLAESQAHDSTAAKDTDLDAREAPAELVQVILEVFAQVSDVQISDLSPDSTIESIGIDSISAIKVASLLKKKDIQVSVSEMLRAKSAARTAVVASQRSDNRSVPSRLSAEVVHELVKPLDVHAATRGAGFDPSHVETAIPATAGQVYMLSIWRKTGGQIFWPTFRYRVQSGMTREDIEMAWEKVRERHRILRTAFVTTSDHSIPVLQLVLNPRLRDKLKSHQPMVHLEIQSKGSSLELELAIHHALYDAVSLPLLLHDLQMMLREQSMSDLDVKQEDLIALFASQEARAKQKRFWTSYLQDRRPIKLPQPAVDGPQQKLEIFNPELFSHAQDLEATARREGLSTQAILFAAYAKVYTSFPAKTGAVATDVVLGVYLSNRSHLSDLDSLAAPTLNLVPLLVREARITPLLPLAKQIQQDLQDIGSPENSAASLWEIAEWTGVKVDTFVNFLKIPERSLGVGSDGAGVLIEEMSDARVKARRGVVKAEDPKNFEVPLGLRNLAIVDAYQYSVDIEMTVTEGKLNFGLFAPTEMIELEVADAALKEFENLLNDVVEK